MGLAERVWMDRSGTAGLLGAALAPLAMVYGVVMRVRSRWYDSGLLSSHEPAIPVISIGNLTVGGAGKTPIAAWIAAQLKGRARPSIVLRGYGVDEVEVHRRLNPGLPVVAAADRVAGVREAQRLGADLVIADDAFQHRRLRRQADVVLVSVEQLSWSRRLLPAGPWREPAHAVRRADLLIFTRKSATLDDARAAGRTLAGERPFMIAHLAPSGLVDAVTGQQVAPGELHGRDVLATAGIGDPAAFAAQLAQMGARITPAWYRDHHAYTADDAMALSRRARGRPVVCTLKDAVKLASVWPASSPLWYVSQHVVVDEGAEHLPMLLERVLAARAGAMTTAG